MRKSSESKPLSHSELVAQNQSLRARLRESAILLDESSDPIFAFHANGEYRYANRAYAEGIGRPVQEIIGRTVWQIFTREEADLRFAIVSDVFGSALAKVFELRVRGPHGDRHYLTTAKPILDDQSRVVSVLCISKDISERKQLEASLHESEQDFRALFMQSPIPMTLNNQSGVILAVNQRFVDVFGYTREDIPDVDTWWERAYPDAAYRAELHAVWQQVREVVAPGKSPIPPMEVRFARKDGELRTVLISGVFIRDYRLMTLDDITERKSLEAALQSDKFKAENASRSKSRFLAAASHDLRQPAHALGMFVARMAELPNDPQARHLVTCMEASVRAMQDMLDGFFDISRLDDESTPLNLVAFPMAGVFEQLQGSFARAAEEKGLRLRFRPTDVWVRTEPGLLQRILLNLVSNALRYTQHGSVLVACRPTRDGTHVRVEVWDSGIGMAAQHHEEIYTEFFQIGNPERDRAKGLGVGLSIVDRACRQLHHPLAMRSVLGQGSRFSLRVPLANDHAQDRPKLAAVAPTWLTLKGLHILFIEDDVLGREGLASLLSSWGCQVTVAAGARMACHLYQTNPCVNLIISDFRLGGDTNGIEAIQMLRALAGKPIAACLVTGDTDASVKNQAQEAGLFFLQKPVRPAKLRSLLRHMLQTGTPEAVSLPG